MNKQLIVPSNWKDYELLDCGNGEKLERFGDLVLIRPEPNAPWPKVRSTEEWDKVHHVRFVEKSDNNGQWIKNKPSLPDHWEISFQNQSIALRFRLGLTSYKHIGLFPEQASNWNYITRQLQGFNTNEEPPRVLNLFAYTGAASLAARAAGARVTHVDSIRQVITWANENQKLSQLSDIRWMVEDAMKFVKREIRRENQYHGIILDPPAYGHGPKGEKWKLEDHIHEIMVDVIRLLDRHNHFLILNTYSLGFGPDDIHQLIRTVHPKASSLETGELCLKTRSGQILPMSAYGRFSTSEGK